MIVGIGNKKGGATKTTVAMAIAGRLQYSGLYNTKILVIDLDDNQDLAEQRDLDVENWNNYMDNEMLDREYGELQLKNKYTVIGTDARNYLKNITEWQKEYDLVLVDMPGNLEQDGIPYTYTTLDKMIVPSGGGNRDRNGTRKFILKFYDLVIPLLQQTNKELDTFGLFTKTLSKDEKKYRNEIKNGKLEEEWGFKWLDKFYPNAQKTFGEYDTTLTETTNSKGEIVYTETTDAIIERLGIKKIEE